MSGGSRVVLAAAMEWLPYVPPLPPIPLSRARPPYFEALASEPPFSVSCRSYHFNYPSNVTLLQILVSLVFMYALRAAGVMQFSSLTLQGARKVGDAAVLLCCAAAAVLLRVVVCHTCMPCSRMCAVVRRTLHVVAAPPAILA